MEAINKILRDASGLTALLSGGADAIYIGHAVQDQAPPYITLESRIIDPFVVKEQAAGVVKEQYEVFIFSKGFGAGDAVAKQVIIALDNVTGGTYNTQDLSSCKLIDRNNISDTEVNDDKWLIILIFESMLTLV